MSQIENKMDDFMPFGGEIRSKYPEDDETVQHAIIDACFAALDDIMYPMDDWGKRPSECQVFFAVQRMYGAEGERDYFLLSDADTIPDEHPFTRDGADWGECGGALACKVLSEPPTFLTFHELAPAAIDQNRELAELVVSVATEPYMDPDKADMREQSIDSLCEEKTEVSESMRYGMEGVGLPMLDAAEHLANY